MKTTTFVLISLLLVRAAFCADEAKPPAPVVLPRMVVAASPDKKAFTLRWSCKGPFQVFKIKRAWFTQIVPGEAADKAGVKVGDELVSLGGVAVTAMTGVGMSENLRQWRKNGTREEVVFRTAQGETKVVEFVYEKPGTKNPNHAIEPTLVAAAPPATESAITEIAGGYSSYRKMTAGLVFVNPELAMLCIGASREQVESARTTKGPHAHSAVVTYMNEIAARDFRRSPASYAPGAVIVKQKTLLSYRGDKSRAGATATDNGVGGMVKRAKGFDPAHGDWEYFYFEDAAKIESGRISSCIKFHDAARGADYVFGTWVCGGGQKGVTRNGNV
jgi:hypothetical protein